MKHVEKIRIGSFQFAVTKDIDNNYRMVEKAVIEAACKGVNLLVFPECALTGYPPHDFKHPQDVDYDRLDIIYTSLENLAKEHNMHILIGTIVKKSYHFYNAALLFYPDGRKGEYDKRALWGWDSDHFIPGNAKGIFEICGIKVGVRICFEVRFPEFFRELYREKTDINILLFYDCSGRDDIERYDLIKAHIRTRAVENVCTTLSVNTAGPFQTAPTAVFGSSGRMLDELVRNTENILIYDFFKKELSFGEKGIEHIADSLTKGMPCSFAYASASEPAAPIIRKPGTT